MVPGLPSDQTAQGCRLKCQSPAHPASPILPHSFRLCLKLRERMQVNSPDQIRYQIDREILFNSILHMIRQRVRKLPIFWLRPWREELQGRLHSPALPCEWKLVDLTAPNPLRGGTCIQSVSCLVNGVTAH